MLEGLRYALDQTGFEWAFGGWSSAPKGDFGVYTLNGQVQFRGDGDSGSEIMLRGYVDYFTHDKTLQPKVAIENALRSIGLWWSLESIQFEPETGFIHYEWSWADADGKADMCVVKFVVNGTVIEQWLQYGETPTAPTLSPYWNGSIPNRVRMEGEWDKPIEEANGNATYTAVWYVLGVIERNAHIDANNVGMVFPSTGEPRTLTAFTAVTFAMFKEAFEAGGGKCVYLSDPSNRYPIISIDGTHGLIIDENGNQDDIYFQVV